MSCKQIGEHARLRSGTAAALADEDSSASTERATAGRQASNGVIAVGPGGEVYVIINNSHRVVKYSADGELLGGWDH